MTKPFRFLASIPPFTDKRSWRDQLRKVEDLGFSTLAVSDHFTGGSVYEPTVAMMAAADATDTLRVACLVHGNDYRHPVMLHKAAANIDVLSGGRLELGVGAGWMTTDYDAAGMPYDRPGERVSRFEESVQIIKGLFGDSPVTYDGRYYKITALDGLPKPAQKPHPPILIGGGGRRVLSIAAREADIVGVNPNLKEGAVTPAAALDMTAEKVDEKVGWVRKGAADAGRDAADLEFEINIFMCRITDSRDEARAAAENVASMFSAEASMVEQSPAILLGSLEQCIETLQERRERYGINYVGLGGDVDMVAPLVAMLAGT